MLAPLDVVEGMRIAMELACVDDKFRAHIPPELAFGEYGSNTSVTGQYKAQIPPHNLIIFEFTYNRNLSGEEGVGRSLRKARDQLTLMSEFAVGKDGQPVKLGKFTGKKETKTKGETSTDTSEL